MNAPDERTAVPPRTGAPEAMPVLSEGRFAGLQAFKQNVRLILAQVAAQGANELILCDSSFDGWPLGESAVVQSLTDWSKTGRKFTLVAQSYDRLPRQHPRFVRWRQTWDHIIECRRCGTAKNSAFPSVIWSPEWVLHHFEGERFEGMVNRQADRRFQLREALSEVMKASAPAFPATTLGL